MDRQELESVCPVPGGREMLIDAVTGRLRPTVPGPPEVASDPVEWPSVHLELHPPGTYENSPARPVNHLLGFPLDHPVDCETSDGGPYRSYQIHPGQFSLYPASVMFAARARTEGRFFMVSITPQFLASHTEELSRHQPLELPSLRAVDDPFCAAVGGLIRAEVSARRPHGRLYIETLAAALSVHLVRTYGRARTENRQMGGLSPSQLRQATGFIHAHLEGDVPLESIARSAGLSAFHFARRFKQTTGMAPHQYVVHHRLDRARYLLVETGVTLAEVAQQSGFCDQSHFTAHFRRQFGITPRRFREQHRG